MKLPKSLTTVTPLSKTLAAILFIALPLFSFFWGVDYQLTVEATRVKEQNISLSSSVNKTTQPSKDTIPTISYDVPAGWEKVEIQKLYTSLRSPDYKVTLVPSISNGAEIKIIQFKLSQDQSLEEYLKARTPGQEVVENLKDLTKVKIGSYEGMRAFICWEGCTDNYYFPINNYVWVINFECAPGCGTKDKARSNKYYATFNSLLTNLTFSSGD